MIDCFNMSIPRLTPEMERRIYVSLPDSYEEDEEGRWPVLYLFDGQNVFFDEDASFGRSWRMADWLEANQPPVIVVGIESSNVGNGRLQEYSPFSYKEEDGTFIRGEGRTLLRWMTDTLKPLIDERYRTLPEREATFIAGSSMGGLIALYGVTHFSDVFGAAAVLSPSLWVHPDKSLSMIDSGNFPPHTLIYMDYGSEEMGNHPANYRCLTNSAVHLMVRDCDLTFRIVPGGSHCEASWETRIPFFMQCLGLTGD